MVEGALDIISCAALLSLATEPDVGYFIVCSYYHLLSFVIIHVITYLCVYVCVCVFVYVASSRDGPVHCSVRPVGDSERMPVLRAAGRYYSS